MHILRANLAERVPASGPILTAGAGSASHAAPPVKSMPRFRPQKMQRQQTRQDDRQRDAEEPPFIPCEVKHRLFLRLAGDRVRSACAPGCAPSAVSVVAIWTSHSPIRSRLRHRDSQLRPSTASEPSPLCASLRRL